MTPVRHVPNAMLPQARERFRGGVVVSTLMHAGIAVLLLVGGRTLSEQYFEAIGTPGPEGGGGGGGGREVRWIALPPLETGAQIAIQQPAPPPETPRQVELELPRPDVRQLEALEPKLDLPVNPTPVAHVTLGRGPGTGGGPGAGTGTGGGVGSGQGPGIGPGTGPGTGGGEGGDVLPPEPKFIILPEPNAPRSARGEYAVHFWVNAEGKVTRVEVDPEIPDSEYRRRFLDRMYQYRFTPARTLNGRPVNGRMTVTIAI
jgi:protein TonB